ncbi:hypothetical protein ES703_72775 [subsurface metagenome]
MPLWLINRIAKGTLIVVLLALVPAVIIWLRGCA